MTIVFPEGVQSLANTSIVLAQTIVDPEAPTKAEVTTATGVVNASCYMYSDFSANRTAARADKPRRACERTARQGFGQETTEISDLQYVESPQGALTDPANKVKAALPDYSSVYIIERRGLPAKVEDLDTGDTVNVHRVEVGPQNRTKTGDGDQDEFSITQSVAHAESWYDVKIVAGA